MWGLDPELLMMVPQPVAALLLLFPISGQFLKRNFLVEKIQVTDFFNCNSSLNSILLQKRQSVGVKLK